MGTIICSHSKCPDQPVMLTFLWSAEITFFLFLFKFQIHFQIFKPLGSRSGSADLGPNWLNSKIVDQDLHCLSDNSDFTTNCSTLNESSFFIYFFLLIFVIVVVCWLFFFKIHFFQKFFQEHCQIVKKFGSRSGLTERGTLSGSQLFALTKVA